LWLIAVLAPLWLGPMLAPLAQAFVEAHHVCACGMAMGTCGCPECERIEEQRRQDEAPPFPVVKGECDKNGTPLANAPVPPMVLPALFAMIVPSTSSVALVSPSRSPVSRAAPPPPTRPPLA
jgi:hypothetical protein